MILILLILVFEITKHATVHFNSSNAVGQAVACASITQRARVGPGSGQVSWVRFFQDFPHL